MLSLEDAVLVFTHPGRSNNTYPCESQLTIVYVRLMAGSHVTGVPFSACIKKANKMQALLEYEDAWNAGLVIVA